MISTIILSGWNVTKSNNSGWKAARRKADLRHVRVHDMKHTFGKRLRVAEVSFEDRQDLLGHKTKNITTHYSVAELQYLIVDTNKLSANDDELRNVPKS
jgi:integrase